jgi:hypothetical protein
VSDYVLFSALYFVVGFCVAVLLVRFSAVGDRKDRERCAAVIMFIWPLCVFVTVGAAILALCIELADYGKGARK